MALDQAATGQQVSVRAIGCSEPVCRLVGTSTVISANGEATFTALAVTKAAQGYSLRFSVDRYCNKFECIGGWSLWAESRRFDVLVGKFAALKILERPFIGVAGADVLPSPRLAATDLGENFITEAAFDVFARKGFNGFGELKSRNDLFFRSAVDGVVLFNRIFFDLASNYDIVFNATVDNISASVTLEDVLITDKEEEVVHTNASQPSPRQVAYVPITPQPVVRLIDRFASTVEASTLAVTAGISAPGVQILGSSVVLVVQGVAVFTDIAIANAGLGFTMQFSAPGVDIIATSAPFDVAPGLADALQVAVQPRNTTVAGHVLWPYPEAVQVDIGGNIVQKPAPLTISLLSDQIAPFQKVGSPAPQLLTNSSELVVETANGTAVFARLRIQVAGTYRLEFARLSMTTQSEAFQILPGIPIGLYMQTEPGVGMSGFELKPFPVVGFQDVYGNFVPNVPKSPAVKAFLLKNTGNSTLLCGGRFPCVRMSVEGRIFFDGLGVNNIGKGYILEFEALLVFQHTGEQRTVRVQSRKFDVTGLEASARVTAQPQKGQCEKALPGLTSVALMDKFGNLAPAASDAINVAIRSAAAQTGPAPSISGVTRMQTTDGVAHFSNLRVDRVGTYILLFSFGLMDTVVESQPFQVAAGEPRLLRFEELPLAVTAGIPFFPVLGIIDACNNAAVDYPSHVSVELSSHPQNLVVARRAQMSSADFTRIAGIAPLNLTIDVKGPNYLLVVHANFPDFPHLADLSLVSSNFTVVVGELHHLQLDGLSPNGVAKETLGPPALVSARDLGNNVVPGFSDLVRARRLRGQTPTSLLEGDVYVKAQNGIATFNILQISEKDPAFVIEFQYQKDFNIPDSNMLRVQSQEIEITGAVRTMRVYKAIDGAFGGDVFQVQPVLAVFDEGGIIVPSYPHTVQARITNSSGDELQGTTSISFAQGIAYFTDLALMTYGDRYIEFTSSVFVAQQSFSVSIGPPAKIVVTTQPTDSFADEAFPTSIVVAVQDRGSNTVLDVFDVHASLRGNRQSSPLLGVTSRQTMNGVASFEQLKVAAVGTGFTIRFEATRLSQTLSVISDQFSLRGKLGGIIATQFPSGGIAFEMLEPPVILRAVDEAYNLCPLDETLTCTAELEDKPVIGGLAEASVLTASMQKGSATFAQLSMDTRGSGYRLRFTCTGGYRTVTTLSPFFTVTNTIDLADGLRLVAFPDVQTFQVGRPLVPLPELRVFDNQDNVVSGSVDVVTVQLVTVGVGELVAGLNGTSTQTISGGMVRFTDLTPFVLGGPFQLKFVLAEPLLEVSTIYLTICVVRVRSLTSVRLACHVTDFRDSLGAERGVSDQRRHSGPHHYPATATVSGCWSDLVDGSMRRCT